MAKSLKTKIRAALRDAVGPEVHILLEDRPRGLVGGVVLSRWFARKTSKQRLDRIDKYLAAHLTPAELERVGVLVTDTPEEWEVLRVEAGTAARRRFSAFSATPG
jgi:hypothetical protein